MKLNDVANQLKLLLSSYTDLFSTNLTVSSIVSDGATATITAPSHGLTTGSGVVLTGVSKETAINSVSKDGLIYTFGTSTDNDLTLNWYRNPRDISTLNQVLFSGFTVPDWNEVHELIDVSNRRTFLIRSVIATIPTLNGNEKLLEILPAINKAFPITVVDDNTFTITGPITAGTYVGGKVSTIPRVYVAVNGQDAWERISSPSTSNNYVMFVLPPTNGVPTSKDRNTLSDAVSTKTSGSDLRIRILDGFSLLIVAPTYEENSAGLAIDICRHDLRAVLYSCLLGAKLNTGLSTDEFKVVPTQDEVALYDRSKLIYQYNFQLPIDTTVDDAVPPADTSAFRDIDFTLEVENGELTTTDFDLDSNSLNA